MRLSAYPDKVFKGRVGFIGPILDPNSRTAKVRIELPNPGMMRVGMFVDATFHGTENKVEATVPADAVLHLHDRDWVYEPSGSNGFKRVEVTGGAIVAAPDGKSTAAGHHDRRRAGRQGCGERSGNAEHGGAVEPADTQMINLLVNFALNNRFLILLVTLLLLVWGAISFHNLPVEAYPDVANNYVQVITQWPGRAAEEVEQQVTIPLEISMNGIPHLDHLRSTSLFGLSSLMLVFDDESSNDWNRQKVLERLTQVNLPTGLQPQIGSDYSPVGQIYWYTLTSTNPQYDLMDLKSIEDWTLEKQFKSVPNVVDVSSFGGTTREYQVRVDPDKLVAYGLNIGQVEQQLANNNVNAGGSFVEAGMQQINVRAIGLASSVSDIENTVIRAQNGTPLRIRDIATVTQGERIRLGQIGKAIHRADGKVTDNSDVVEGIVLLRKGADSDSTLEGDSRQGGRTQHEDSAAGREDCSRIWTAAICCTIRPTRCCTI